MDDIDTPDSKQPDRRSILKKAGIVGVGIWAAPVVTSITSPAFAQGSPPTGRGCIVLTAESRVTVSYSSSACNTLAFGLVGGPQVCGDCSRTGAGGAVLGTFAAGSDLRFYFEDNGFGSCCTTDRSCNARYECGSGTTHIGVQKVSDSTYIVYFVDAGCECERVGQSAPPQAGPGVSNLTVTVTLTPTG